MRNQLGTHVAHLLEGQLARSNLIPSEHKLWELVVQALDDRIISGFAIFVGLLLSLQLFFIDVTVVELCHGTRKFVASSSVVLVDRTPAPAELR